MVMILHAKMETQQPQFAEVEGHLAKGMNIATILI